MKVNKVAVARQKPEPDDAPVPVNSGTSMRLVGEHDGVFIEIWAHRHGGITICGSHPLLVTSTAPNAFRLDIEPPGPQTDSADG